MESCGRNAMFGSLMREDSLVPVEAVFRDQHRNAQWLARRLMVLAPRTGAYAS